MKKNITYITPKTSKKLSAIKLSVGMIVKNEAKHLRNCLTALAPLLNAVKSELIIVDTGSTDDTAAIAKEFTDKVFFFEWINDFSAARNFSLKKSSGEWFMFLDADEYLDGDINEMIEFFNNDRLNQKHSFATYIQMNLVADDGSDTSLFYVLRIARVTSDLHFVGRVHEGFNMAVHPIYHFRAHVRHYGYWYETDEARKEKFERNKTLVLKELETKPDSVRLLVQLFQVLTDPDEKEECIGKALELARKAIRPQDRTMVFINVMFHYANFKRRDELLRLTGEYIEFTDANDVSLADTYAYRAHAFYSLERFEEAAAAFDKYFEYYRKYQNKELDVEVMIYQDFHFLTEQKYLTAKNLYLYCVMKRGRFVDVLGAFDAPALAALGADTFDALLTVVKEAIKQDGAHARLGEFYSNVLNSGNSKRAGEAEIVMLDFYYKAEDKHTFVYDFISGLNACADDGLITLFKLINTETESGWADELRRFAEDSPEGIKYAETLYLLLKYEMDLGPFLRNANFEQLNEYLYTILYAHPSEYAELVLSFCRKINAPESAIPVLTFMLSALYLAVTKTVQGSMNMNEAEKTEIYTLFSVLAPFYFVRVYNGAVVTEDVISAMPELCRFGFFMGKAQRALYAKDELGYVKALRTALNTSENFTDVVRFLKKSSETV